MHIKARGKQCSRIYGKDTDEENKVKPKNYFGRIILTFAGLH